MKKQSPLEMGAKYTARTQVRRMAKQLGGKGLIGSLLATLAAAGVTYLINKGLDNDS